MNDLKRFMVPLLSVFHQSGCYCYLVRPFRVAFDDSMLVRFVRTVAMAVYDLNFMFVKPACHWIYGGFRFVFLRLTVEQKQNVDMMIQGSIFFRQMLFAWTRLKKYIIESVTACLFLSMKESLSNLMNFQKMGQMMIISIGIVIILKIWSFSLDLGHYLLLVYFMIMGTLLLKSSSDLKTLIRQSLTCRLALLFKQ